MSKKLYEFSEKEIIEALSSLSLYTGEWVTEVDISRGSSMNDGYDIHEAAKKAILNEWIKAREIHAEREG